MSDQLNKQDEDGWTALMLEALRGNEKEVLRLLDDGADPYLENAQGELAIWLAIEEDNYYLVEKMLSYFEVNHKTKEGATLLAKAEHHGNSVIIELIKSRGGVSSGPVPSLENSDQICAQAAKEYIEKSNG